MDENHHSELIESIANEYQDILNNSEQGVYIYLDDANKVCNQKFATLLGYTSAGEWEEQKGSFPDLFVAEESQGQLIKSFQDAMDNSIGSTNNIVWKKKAGGIVNSTVILVPISYNGHLFALHFVSS